MTTKLNRRILPVLLISSMLMISACASTKSGAAIAQKTDEASSVTLKEGEFQTPPVIQQSGTPMVNETVKTTVDAPAEATKPANPNSTRINSRAPLVNARTAPTARSRVVAVLKKGQEVEVLEKKHGWLKIKWHHGATVKHGWINKSFVEGFEQ